MAVYKDKDTGKWRSIYRFTDWTGARKQTQHRGFGTKKEAEAWESEMRMKHTNSLSMTFESFWELYKTDKLNRLKRNTLEMKKNVVETKILPYFAKRKMNEIIPLDIISWQDELLKYRDGSGKGYSPAYLKTIHAQLSAIFNYAQRFYNLPTNPARNAGTLGGETSKEMLFWTKEEYERFADAMMDKPLSFYAFEMLYWCGIRLGELLALTPADIDFETHMLTINKSYQRIKGEDVITPPKTPKSNRVISMPEFLCEEMKEFIGMEYGLKDSDRIFKITKAYLHHEMARGAAESGVKKIRIHDLRHSHVSLLIEMGFSPLAIAERVGHESIRITYHYAHLFPNKQTEIADRLDSEKDGGERENGKVIGWERALEKQNGIVPPFAGGGRHA